MDFSSAADELYGVLPAEFVAARKRLAQEARRDGDAALARRIGALRRPTLSAWAVNLLSRSAAGDLDRLLDVGAEMRSAWGSGSGLRDLEQRRAGLVGSLVRAAGELAAEAGGALREQAVREVEDTLQAATVDADIAEEVRAGRLAQPRSHTGFVPAGFPMAPPGRERRTKPEPRERPPKREEPKPDVTRTSAARARRAETLRKRAEEAGRRLAERGELADAAKREAEEAAAEVGRLRHELDRAVAARDAASRRAERAEQNRARAEEAAREAREAAAEARRAADHDARRG
ncbi:hypothetical protein [Actinomadura latina]|uniref:Uncharacterized protein n=1 Tax=Actinomadura latina TaxID=163603 RepID=A0A846YTM2_9ACTN|nr:hypothetical protein [Actinomadura latina]NKZ04220.1 hypothetical protein [Actinomadura latina]